MKKNYIFIGAKEIHGAFAGDTIDLGQVWSHVAISLDANMNSPRSRPGHNNGLFQFLVDDMNNASGYFNLTDIKRTLENGDGKLYTAVREFIPRKGKQTTKYNKINCENGEAAQGYKNDAVSFGREFVGRPFTISKEFVRCIHAGTVDYQNKVFAEELRTYLDALGVDVENYFMTKSFVGNFAKGGGTDCKALPLFNALGNTINYTGEAQITEDMLQAETGGLAPVLIGGTKLSLYADMRKFVVANNYIGLDVLKRNELMAQMGTTPMFYRSTNVGAANYKGAGANADRMIAIMPGAVKLVNMALNDLEWGNTPTKRLEVYVDPYYGLRHDVTMRIDECAPGGPAITMQFSCVYDVIGYPDCWSDDTDFAGVTDVFCYTIECSDDGVCSIPAAAGSNLQLSAKLEKCGPGSDPCQVTCDAQFTIACQRAAVFSVDALASGNISAVQINGMNFNLDAVYDISTQAGADGLTVALQTALKYVSQVLQVSGGWETVGGDAEYYFVGDTSLTSVKLINDSGADIDLTRVEGNFAHITDNSTVSTGADYATSTLNWTAPDTTVFAGFPGDSIFSSVTSNHYGVMGNYFAEYSAGGIYTLDLVDSEGCNDSYATETDPCL